MKHRGSSWIAVLLLSACATSPTGRSQLTLLPDSQMSAMGKQAFEEMQQKTPKETDPKLTAYVSCVAKTVTSELNDNGAAWDVVLFKDDAVIAFALPGVHIGVYSGQHKTTKNQKQHTTEKRHEVAHV